jgi:membrane-bound ClpP family serine protease
MNPLLWLSLAIFGLAVFVIGRVVSLIHRSRREKQFPSGPKLIGSEGTVTTKLDPIGSILVKGELWPAADIDRQRVGTGTRIKVVGSRDHVLKVAVLQKS